MAAIGAGWADGAWVEAGWVSGAWEQDAGVVTPVYGWNPRAKIGAAAASDRFKRIGSETATDKFTKIGSESA